MTRANNYAYALVTAGVLGFAVNAGVSRLVLDAGINSWTLATLRTLGATVLLAVIVALWHRSRWRPARRDWPRLLVYGLALGLMQALFFEAIARIPIGVALLVQYLAPVWVALWARLVRRQPVRGTLWLALLLTLVGLALVAGTGVSETDLIGVAVAVGSGACFAVYFVLGEDLVGASDPFVVTLWGFVIAAACWTLLSVAVPAITPVWDIDLSIPVSLPIAIGGATVTALALVVWIVSFGTVMPFAAETAAMRHIPATTVSVMATAEPIVAAVVAWWWFDEVLSGWQITGGLLVIAGIVLALLSRAGHRLPAGVD